MLASSLGFFLRLKAHDYNADPAHELRSSHRFAVEPILGEFGPPTYIRVIAHNVASSAGASGTNPRIAKNGRKGMASVIAITATVDQKSTFPGRLR